MPKGYVGKAEPRTLQSIAQVGEDGQIVLLEGCSGCGASNLDHSPIKVPNVLWEREDEKELPRFTRHYDFLCFKCARAMLAVGSEEELDELEAWREKHNLGRMTFEDIQCPKIETT